MTTRLVTAILIAAATLTPAMLRADTVDPKRLPAAEPTDRRLAMTLEAATRSSSLIVHARFERIGNRSLYKILDTLHGVAEPEMFQGQAPKGYLDLFRSDRVGTEQILFFFRIKGIRSYEWYLPVENGKVIYKDQAVALADFKKQLQDTRPTNSIPLEELVPKSALIVHCRTEEVAGRVYYRLLEVLKGSVQKVTFARTAPEGYFNLGANRAGVELVMVFNGQEKLNSFDAFFPIRDGKVLYRGQQLIPEVFFGRVRRLAGPVEGRSAAASAPALIR